ncbi:tyrosine-type recombinase/integrase [Micromonospora sp. WMMD737]|uniref:tyrosine-type recombinase/integrase n=1 Tax=Micromonospora sp. WMMD737 TaxID=3404113 RepID=UPI003B964F62
MLGKVERIRRGGYRSEKAARRACDELLALSREEQAGRSWTVARWLRYWLSTRKSIRPTTRMHYTRDIEHFLIPHIGHLILGDLNSRQLDAAFTQIAGTRNRTGQPQTVCTLQHIHATLRAALSRAQRDRLITDNPARGLELPPRERLQPEVWTDARVAEWKATGERPVIAVWTAAQLAAFLDFVRDDTLYALWWLIALRGLRRGEAAGLRWADVDLHEGQLSVVRQRTTAGYDVHEGPPKSAASRRLVALDKHTVQVLRQQRQRQQDRRARRVDANKVCHDSGYVFTSPDGLPLHPGYLTQRLRLLVDRAGLPPIRLHDLRHGAASLAHSAGADIKTVQDQLGHANIRVTADIYTTVLPPAAHKAAEITASYLIKAGKPGAEIKRQIDRTRDTDDGTAPAPTKPHPEPDITGAGARKPPKHTPQLRVSRRRTHRRAKARRRLTSRQLTNHQELAGQPAPTCH